jgi:hypothetical protein
MGGRAFPGAAFQASVPAAMLARRLAAHSRRNASKKRFGMARAPPTNIPGDRPHSNSQARKRGGLHGPSGPYPGTIGHARGTARAGDYSS